MLGEKSEIAAVVFLTNRNLCKIVQTRKALDLAYKLFPLLDHTVFPIRLLTIHANKL